MLRAVALVLVVTLAACAPKFVSPGASAQAPRMGDKAFVMADGTRLPVTAWDAKEPRAVLIGVHGFNDYANAFHLAGPWFAAHGVSLIAYDQRGFGRSQDRGYWAKQAYADDLASVIDLVRAHDDDLPIFLLGESMGGAVVLETLGEGHVAPEGAILVAPAVWGWSKLNPFYAATLWSAAHTVPWVTLSGSRLDRWPSDNLEMLYALGSDPLMIRETRIDTIYGLVGQMDRGLKAAPDVEVPLLLLYGANDEIIPEEPVAALSAELPPQQLITVCYPDGWHMLLRDLQRETVWRDILAFMDNPQTDELPSESPSALDCASSGKVHPARKAQDDP